MRIIIVLFGSNVTSLFTPNKPHPNLFQTIPVHETFQSVPAENYDLNPSAHLYQNYLPVHYQNYYPHLYPSSTYEVNEITPDFNFGINNEHKIEDVKTKKWQPFKKIKEKIKSFFNRKKNNTNQNKLIEHQQHYPGIIVLKKINYFFFYF